MNIFMFYVLARPNREVIFNRFLSSILEWELLTGKNVKIRNFK